MKSKLYFGLIAIAFSMGAYAQVDVKSDKMASSFDIKENELVQGTDKGKIVDNGLFFTKSFYEETSSNSMVVSESVKKQLSKIFEIEVTQGGNYYFAAHILPVNDVEKINAEKISQSPVNKITSDKVDILEVRVYLNDRFIGTLNQTKLDWELVPLKEVKMVSLQAGKNMIRIESDAPYYPMVDAVRITQSAKDLLIENKGYNTFVSQLKSSSSHRVLPAEKETQEEVDRKVIEQNDMPQLRSAQYPDSYEWQVTPTTFSCPECTYSHRMNVPVTFTYYRKLSLSSGNYTFNTEQISGDTYYSVDPVMYLYKIDAPHTYSWCNDDYNSSTNGRHSWISVSNIPAGDYYLVVRAFSSYYGSTSLGRQGLVNVYQNGTLLNSNAPVSGYMFDVSSSNTGLLNYFTAYSTGIPVIWLVENNSSGINNTKMKFKGETFGNVRVHWF